MNFPGKVLGQIAIVMMVFSFFVRHGVLGSDHGGGHGEAPAAEHGGGHGSEGGHGGEHGGGEHGGGHGEAPPPQPTTPPRTDIPKDFHDADPVYPKAKGQAQYIIDNKKIPCKIPESHKNPVPQCGSKAYAEYMKEVQEYNDCVEPFKSRILLPIRGCRNVPPKKKKEPDVKRLLNVP